MAATVLMVDAQESGFLEILRIRRVSDSDSLLVTLKRETVNANGSVLSSIKHLQKMPFLKKNVILRKRRESLFDSSAIKWKLLFSFNKC